MSLFKKGVYQLIKLTMNNDNSRPSKETSKPINYHPVTDADKLALEIAKALGEEKKLPLYRMVCENRSEEVVRRAFERTKKTPQQKIKKSRSALFFYLVNKYADEKQN
jgi:hypothetical protein